MNVEELGAEAFWVVVALGTLSGFASCWAFRHWCDKARLRAAINRVVAHMLEFRLFADEPVLVMRAQRDLLVANGALLRALMGTSLILAVPFAIVLIGVNAVFGRAPIQPGNPAIVTLQCRSSIGSLPQVQLIAPRGIEIETAPVRIPRTSEICWRIRPQRAVRGQLELRLRGRSISKSISSASGMQWLSPVRAGSLTSLLSAPYEMPFEDSAAKSIALTYPEAQIFGYHWSVWFTLASVAGAVIYWMALRWASPGLLAILN